MGRVEWRCRGREVDVQGWEEEGCVRLKRELRGPQPRPNLEASGRKVAPVAAAQNSYCIHNENRVANIDIFRHHNK